jgi:hypothetical protein
MAKKSSAAETLSPLALNRALLARQMLLERTAVSPAIAIEHLVGLQAQVPSDPFFALWSRLADFDPEELSELIASRKAVRMAAQRGTLHLLSASDALPMRRLVQPVLTRMVATQAFGKQTRGINLAKLRAAGAKLLKKSPMTLAELRPALAEAFPGYDPAALAWVFHYHTPLVQVPPRGLWRQGGAPRVTTGEQWLKQRGAATASPAKIVLRYLAAFGPASVMDAQAWSGLTKLAPVFEKLRPKLVTFRDGEGRELFDLPEASRPDPDTPAPPRFLPVYDNVVLGFANRARIVDAKPNKPPPDNAWVKTFLLDGFVAGFWKIAEDGKTATLLLEPFGKPAKKQLAALKEEGARLLDFAAPQATRKNIRTGPAR